LRFGFRLPENSSTTYIDGTGSGVVSDQTAGIKWTAMSNPSTRLVWLLATAMSILKTTYSLLSGIASLLKMEMCVPSGCQYGNGVSGTSPDPVDRFKRFRELADDDEDYDSQWSPLNSLTPVRQAKDTDDECYRDFSPTIAD
jgi:hypothetical protein